MLYIKSRILHFLNYYLKETKEGTRCINCDFSAGVHSSLRVLFSYD